MWLLLLLTWNCFSIKWLLSLVIKGWLFFDYNFFERRNRLVRLLIFQSGAWWALLSRTRKISLFLRGFIISFNLYRSASFRDIRIILIHSQCALHLKRKAFIENQVLGITMSCLLICCIAILPFLKHTDVLIRVTIRDLLVPNV